MLLFRRKQNSHLVQIIIQETQILLRYEFFPQETCYLIARHMLSK